MTGFEFFAAFGLPAIIVAIAGLATYLHLRDLKRKHKS
jgi:hypothetical protein